MTPDLDARIRGLPDTPGIYVFRAAGGEALYVGKAKSLKRRVVHYLAPQADARLQAMVDEAADLEFVATHTEAEALLLENNWIKRRRPRFNVLLRDDKTYPYLKLTVGEEWPRLVFTRRIGGEVECGPNAVLAFAREGYRKSNVNLFDLGEALTYPGFLRLAVRYWKAGLEEIWRSISKAAFVRALQRLVPEIRGEDLEAAPAGVPAQAVARNGQLVDDFLIEESHRVVHVGNAPSPAATSSLNIGKLIVDRLAARFE